MYEGMQMHRGGFYDKNKKCKTNKKTDYQFVEMTKKQNHIALFVVLLYLVGLRYVLIDPILDMIFKGNSHVHIWLLHWH